MNSNNNGSFWPSYVDIMTTLFAIMLVLFVVSYSRFKAKESENQKMLFDYEVLIKEYEDIMRVYEVVQSIDETEYFKYDENYLKHLFTLNVEYQTKAYRIDELKLDLIDKTLADKKRENILEAGRIVEQKLKQIEESNSDNSNIKFLVIIEGQSSKIKFNEGDWRNNYTLSYLRAQFLEKFWRENGIDLSERKKCELLIVGSGEKGVPRVVSKGGENSPEWIEDEMQNQRFLINIVPVIGSIDETLQQINELKRKHNM